MVTVVVWMRPDMRQLEPRRDRVFGPRGRTPVISPQGVQHHTTIRQMTEHNQFAKISIQVHGCRTTRICFKSSLGTVRYPPQEPVSKRSASSLPSIRTNLATHSNFRPIDTSSQGVPVLGFPLVTASQQDFRIVPLSVPTNCPRRSEWVSIASH